MRLSLIFCLAIIALVCAYALGESHFTDKVGVQTKATVNTLKVKRQLNTGNIGNGNCQGFCGGGRGGKRRFGGGGAGRRRFGGGGRRRFGGGGRRGGFVSEASLQKTPNLTGI